jgi:uncharacterized protein (UPF0212 family)
MEQSILKFLDTIGKVDFSSVWQVFFYALGVFWIVVLYWIWLDSGDRTSNRLVRVGYVLLGLVFNIVGLIIYLIVRPTQTIEEIYWSDLERRYLKFETAELGDCPKCGAQLYPGFRFCPQCRYRLKIKCPSCNVYMDRKYKYCPHCGEEAHKSATFVSQAPTKEVMQEQIAASRIEAVAVVEESRTRYSVKKDVVLKVGESIIAGYKIIGKKIVSLFEKSRDMVKGGKQQDSVVKVSQNNQKKKKNRKKKR